MRGSWDRPNTPHESLVGKIGCVPASLASKGYPLREMSCHGVLTAKRLFNSIRVAAMSLRGRISAQVCWGRRREVGVILPLNRRT